MARLVIGDCARRTLKQCQFGCKRYSHAGTAAEPRDGMDGGRSADQRIDREPASHTLVNSRDVLSAMRS